MKPSYNDVGAVVLAVFTRFSFFNFVKIKRVLSLIAAAAVVDGTLSKNMDSKPQEHTKLVEQRGAEGRQDRTEALPA